MTPTKIIFVFGSNLAGRHGRGAALHARKAFNAEYGVGEGLTGNSYAIPTKDASFRILPLGFVRSRIEDFLHFAEENPALKFQITRIGCGLAGFSDNEIAPMFKNSPKNCFFYDPTWGQPVEEK